MPKKPQFINFALFFPGENVSIYGTMHCYELVPSSAGTLFRVTHQHCTGLGQEVTESCCMKM